MSKGSPVPVLLERDWKEQQVLLAELAAEVDEGRYSPNTPHGFLSNHKTGGVPRFVPVLHYRDSAIYFASVSALDEALAEGAVSGTFGGFALGGERREREARWSEPTTVFVEEDPVEGESGTPDDSEYTPLAAYNPAAWMAEWHQYWAKACHVHSKAARDAQFVVFDVANFYDSIDLPRLERLIRSICPDSAMATEVLMYLLTRWNRLVNRYAPSTKGLPMDHIGDCSRILANAFLIPFDDSFMAWCQERGATYIRWADDMTVVCPKGLEAEQVVFAAAERLNTIGLHINASKVKTFTRKEFGTAWGFKVLLDLASEDSFSKGLNALKRKYADPQYARKGTAFRKALTTLAGLPDHEDAKAWAWSVIAADPDMPLHLSHGQLRSAVLIAPCPATALGELAGAIMKRPFTEPKARLLWVAAQLLKHKDAGLKAEAKRIVDSFAGVDDPVLQLAHGHLVPKGA